DPAVGQRFWHQERFRREVLVVASTRRQLETTWRALITVHECDDVVGPRFLILREKVDDEIGEATLESARLGDHGHIGRGSSVDGGSRLLIWKWRRKIVGRPTWPFEHLALVVRPVVDFIVGRDRLDLLV